MIVIGDLLRYVGVSTAMFSVLETTDRQAQEGEDMEEYITSSDCHIVVVDVEDLREIIRNMVMMLRILHDPSSYFVIFICISMVFFVIVGKSFRL